MKEVFEVLIFVVMGVVLLGYALLGGYDIGVGNLYLFNKSKSQRKEMMENIGPYWDANQVWLVTFGGGLFAAFPFVFSTVFSGFYLAMMLVLFGITIRTISIEFRYQLNTPRWSKIFDLCFGIGSILLSILFGVAMGNILRGIPLAASKSFSTTLDYAGGFFDLLNPYAIAMGVFSLALFFFHGSNFLNAAGKEDLRKDVRKNIKIFWCALLLLFAVLSVWTYAASPHLFQSFFNFPLFFAFPAIALLGLVAYPFILRDAQARLKPLLTSAVIIIGMIGTAGVSLFPRIVPDLTTADSYRPAALTAITGEHLTRSLTIANASSSNLTLAIMAAIAGIGVPVMLCYTVYVYRVFFKR